jgi:hypothetical protein
MFLTELDNLLLGWCHDINLLDRMCHTSPDALQTQRQDMQVLSDDGDDDINRLCGGSQLRKPSPGKQAVSDLSQL